MRMGQIQRQASGKGVFKQAFFHPRSVANVPMSNPFLLDAISRYKQQDGLAPQELTSTQIHEGYQKISARKSNLAINGAAKDDAQ